MFKLKLIQKLFMHGLTQNMAKEFRLSDEKKKEFLEKKMHKYSIHFTRSMLSDTFRGVSTIKKVYEDVRFLRT